MKKATNCKECGVRRSSDNWRTTGRGALCAACFAAYQKTYSKSEVCKTKRNARARARYAADPAFKVSANERSARNSPNRLRNKDPNKRASDNARRRERRAANDELRERHNARTRAYAKSPEGRSVHRALKAKRRAQEKQARPKWVDDVAMANIHKNRPSDNHVDHIIPINAPLIEGTDTPVVCGLDVPWNLQYLPVKDNLRKNNSFDGTYENDGWRCTTP